MSDKTRSDKSDRFDHFIDWALRSILVGIAGVGLHYVSQIRTDIANLNANVAVLLDRSATQEGAIRENKTDIKEIRIRVDQHERDIFVLKKDRQ